MLIFLSLFGIILAALHSFLLTHILILVPHYHTGLTILFFCLWLLTLGIIPLTHVLRRQQVAMIAQIAFLWMGFSLIAICLLGLTDLLWLGVRALAHLGYLDEEIGYQLYPNLLGGSLAISVLLSCYAAYHNIRFPMIKKIVLPIRNLPPSFQHLRIIQLTDLHIGPMLNHLWLEAIVKRVNELKPDLVLLTGDLVDGSVEDCGQELRSLSQLKASYGIFGVTGNHELYSGVEAWCQFYQSLGIQMLRNQIIPLKSSSGERLYLAGLDDQQITPLANSIPALESEINRLGATWPILLMSHQPNVIKKYNHDKIALMLSGHTHGGQLWPFTHLVRLQQPFRTGLHRVAETHVYVSPGTGFWGPPMRLGTRSEISVIELTIDNSL